MAAPILIITADDYGYSPRYNRGILTAASAGAVDAVSAMVCRPWCDPAPLLATGVEIGLHLELAPGRDPRALLAAQLSLFGRLFGHPAAYLDGHHHCHATGEAARVVADEATRAGLPVRSVSESHRAVLRKRGARTPDLFIGRHEPEEAALPAGLSSLPAGVTEWMVHPGLSDPAAGSSYDEAREEDLSLLLSFPRAAGAGGGAVRAGHAAALG